MSPASEEKLIFSNATLIGGAMEVTPEQVKTIIDATADAGYRGVSLWAFHHLAAVGAGVSPEQVRAWHRDRGLSVPVVESLLGWESGDADAIDAQCMPTFEIASFYGAEMVAGVVMSADPIPLDAASAGLAHLGKRGAERGLKVCIEWLPWSALPDIATAWKLVEDVGADNLGLVFDTWHWLRQPGGPDFETLRRIPGERIHLVQLDDAMAAGQGDDVMMESMTQRLLPGEGDVDFPAVLAALDEIGADPIWAPEVFNVELMEQGPVEMARRVGQATRKVLGL
ncbi:MAG: sugar phosphate isomerase/epimerase [Deltaproteobacteria bacterium]|jgi:sugar phosphate isomerase/epimerase|nr:sugar phosphate isomerase/epimerase [Deltaproteobacteria bacterium]